jgi:putative nucleotidyltransferase with HDIG domain
MEALRRHSVATAHAARLVCRATSLPDDYAFLCGLLHDIGAAASLLALGDMVPGQAAPPLATLRSVIWQLHAGVGRDVCNAWKLPPEIALVIDHHHEPRIGGHVHPLAAAVRIADQLASQAGFASPVEPTAAGELENLLGLPEPALLRLRTEATRHLGTLSLS